MEKKNSSVFGIPFAVLVFVVVLAVLVDGFMWFFVFNPLKSVLGRVDTNVSVVEHRLAATPTATPTATPSATVTPTRFFNVPRQVNPTK